ncbi:MAG: hypothetical protein ACI923_002647, partial [Flavobacteriales bacterium]
AMATDTAMDTAMGITMRIIQNAKEERNECEVAEY